jgi:hypothetical protein
VADRLRAIAADLRNIINAESAERADDIAHAAASEIEAIAREVGR